MEIKTLVADDDGENNPNNGFFDRLNQAMMEQAKVEAMQFLHQTAMPYLKSALRYCYEKSEDGSELVNRTIVRNFIEEMICQLAHEYASRFGKMERTAADDAEYLVFMQDAVIRSTDLADDTREYFAFIDRINFG